jgi:ATP-binding cassette subfamily C protein CydD
LRTAAARLLTGRTGVVVAHDGGWREVADEILELAPPGSGKPHSGPVRAAMWLS